MTVTESPTLQFSDAIFRYFRLTFLALLCAMTVGCETVPSDRDTVSEPPPAPDPATGRETLGVLHDRALAALARDHLMHPEADSAYVLFNRMTAVDPGNEDARRGMERIVERYLALAEDAAAERRFAGARSMLARARLVDRDHPGIDAVAHQVNLLQNAERAAIRLDATRLGARDAGLARELRLFGASARSSRCLSTIFTARDADARWIYEQLSNAEGSGRIRADFQFGSPARVETLCFAAAD